MSARHKTGRFLVGALAVVLVGAALPAAVTGGMARAASLVASAQAASPAAGQLIGVATLPEMSVAAVQNSRLPGSIDNDRQLVLGGIGSDLWRSPSDPAGEFWMAEDGHQQFFEKRGIAPTCHVRALAG